MHQIKLVSYEGVKAIEILQTLVAQFGDKTIKKAQIYERHKQLLGARETVENED